MKPAHEELKLKLYRNEGLFYVKGSAKRVKIQKLDKDLALFLGMMWGDGRILKREIAEKNGNWRIGIVEDDVPLIQHFVKLTEKVFSIKPKINDRVTKLEAYFNNRIVYEILNKEYGFPDGEKIGKLHIPKPVLNSEKLTCSFLAGVFSTDGKFVVYKNYPRICVESATLPFIQDMEKALVRFNFKPRFSTWNRKNGNKLYGLYLNGFEQIKQFNRKIGFIGGKANKLGIFLAHRPRATAP